MIVCIQDDFKAAWLRQTLLITCLTAMSYLTSLLAETTPHLVRFSKPISWLEHDHVTKICLRRPKEKYTMASGERFSTRLHKLNV